MSAFPAVILLYAWWKRGRIGLRDFVASAPFFAISLVLSVLTSWGSGVYMHSQLKTPAPVDIGGFLFRFV